MPELPEVETIKEDLNKGLSGLSFSDIKVLDKRVLKTSPQQFIKSLKGKTIQSVSRRGKAVLFNFDDQSAMAVQLKMTGQLIYHSALEKAILKETKIIFTLSNYKILVYNDQRVFGKLIYLKNLNDYAYMATIGPEPLETGLNVAWLKENLKKRETPIKPLLMNQEFLAGIGNIYASEILFHAGIKPEKKARQLKEAEIEKLYRSIREVLQEAIKLRGCSMRNYRDSSGQKGRFMEMIKVYAREDEACSFCQKPIKKIVQAGRSTFFCQRCQH